MSEEVNKMANMNQQNQINQLQTQGMPEQQAMDFVNQQNQIKQAVTGGAQNPQMQTQDPNMQQGGGDPFGNNVGGPVPPDQFPGAGGGQGPPQFGDPNLGVQQGPDPFGGPGGLPAPGQDPYGMPGGPDPMGGPGGPGGFGGDPMGGEMGTGEYSGMQPSLMSQQGGPGGPGGPGEYSAVGGAPQPGAGGAQEADYAGGQGGGFGDPYGAEAYPMYQPYPEAMGSDMITEISEQIVEEKLAGLQDKLERVLDMRTIVEANMLNLNDRLKRMEKIVDQMQVSILKKVGQYLTDVQDVKKELHETQRSFTAIHKDKKKAHKKS